MVLYVQFRFFLNGWIFGLRMVLVNSKPVTFSWQMLCCTLITRLTTGKCYNIYIFSLIIRYNYYLVIEWYGCEIFIWIVLLRSKCVYYWLTLETHNSYVFFLFLHKLAIDIRFFRFPYRHMKSVMLGLLSIVMGWNLVL